MKFLPRPPKQHFATKMAKIEPRTGYTTGVLGDRDRARSMPVTAALPSKMDRGFLHARQNRASVPTAARMEARITSRAFHP